MRYWQWMEDFPLVIRKLELPKPTNQHNDGDQHQEPAQVPCTRVFHTLSNFSGHGHHSFPNIQKI